MCHIKSFKLVIKKKELRNIEVFGDISYLKIMKSLASG